MIVGIERESTLILVREGTSHARNPWPRPRRDVRAHATDVARPGRPVRRPPRRRRRRRGAVRPGPPGALRGTRGLPDPYRTRTGELPGAVRGGPRRRRPRDARPGGDRGRE